MSQSQRVIKNTLFLYMRTAVSLLVNVFTTRILLDALGVEDYGLYNVVGGAIAMLGFLSASMSSVTQRFLSYAEGAGDIDRIVRYFNNSIVIHYALALFMAVALAVAALFFFNGILNIPEGKQSAALAVYGCMLLATTFSITTVPYEAEINAHEDMLFYALLGIGDVLAKFVIALLIFYTPDNQLVCYAILMAVESFLLRAICQWYCKRSYRECCQINLRKNFDKGMIKEMLSFSGWNLANIATGMISLYGMNVVVNHYFGAGVNAAMAIATQLSGIMMGISANMIKAVTPVLVKSEGANQHEKMLAISYVSCKFSYLLFSCVGLPVLLFLPTVLSVWLTVIPEWTYEFCLILILATLAEQLTIVLYHSIMAGGDIRNYNIARSIVNILPIVLGIVVFQYGDAKPYWILINWMLFKSIGGGIVNVVYARSTLGLSLSRFVKRVIVPTLLSSSVVILIGVFFLHCGKKFQINDLWGIVAVCSISIPIYWMMALNGNERMALGSFINKIVTR